ncbi:hypothetical protein [Streptomyces syringium]|uniref:hypothetical protein n=1 Tax=Streptomyces syringium TaxID=76729 RepID=UPI0037D421FC
MSQMSQFLHTAVTYLADDPIVPKYKPSVPGTLQTPTGKILSWTSGIGLTLAVLGGLAGWGCVAIGHNTERGGLAARGKQAIVWSLISGMGIGVTSGLVLAFYGMTQGG